MPEKEESISVNIRLCDMEVGANQRNKNRVKKVVQELKEDLSTFIEVWLWQLGIVRARQT